MVRALPLSPVVACRPAAELLAAPTGQPDSSAQQCGAPLVLLLLLTVWMCGVARAGEAALVASVLSSQAMQSGALPAALMRAYVGADHVVGLDVDRDSFDKFTMRSCIGEERLACVATCAFVGAQPCDHVCARCARERGEACATCSTPASGARPPCAWC